MRKQHRKTNKNEDNNLFSVKPKYNPTKITELEPKTRLNGYDIIRKKVMDDDYTKYGIAAANPSYSSINLGEKSAKPKINIGL